jgi:hypothetical protein
MEFTKRLIPVFLAAVIVTLVFGSVYASFQQVGRRSANDAPRAAAAAQAQVPDLQSAPEPRLELTADSGVFVIVYGSDDKPVSATAVLHGQLPVLPAGVLDEARTAGSDAVTWQPEPGLRMAVVARRSGDSVVLAGQSLSPYEDRDRVTLIFLGLGWLGCILVLAAGYWITELPGRRRPSNDQ